MTTSILVIEDELEIRENVVETLEYEGFACISAQGGNAGLQLAHDFLPDLIICDVMMPDLDGYSVLDNLRSDPLTMNIPFVFLTAQSEHTAVRHGMGLGADDYLTKPFKPEELVAAVATRLQKRASLVQEYTSQANELRQALVHGLPHELRTPLAAILGGTELMLNDPVFLSYEEGASLARDVREAAQRLKRQIENYLFYAQLQIARLDPEQPRRLQRAQVDGAGAVIRDVAQAKATVLGRTEDLVLSVQDGGARISADNLTKIVAELVDNAFKFSKVGTRVTVSSEVREDDYVLKVNDVGRGMTVEQIQRVGAFMQFGRELYEQQGSGLGLAIVKALAELHGGALSIQSEPGYGTRISIKLPFIQSY